MTRQFYLYVHEDGSTEQRELATAQEISQDDLASIDNGILDIYRYEQSRGFCRLMVEPSEEDEETFVIADWERTRGKV